MVEKLINTIMRILKYITLVMFLVAIFSSCEVDYESHIIKETPAPHLELIGGNPLVLFKGTPYVDPGIHATITINGETTELPYTIHNEVNVDVTGTYRLMYEVRNSEDIPFYISRRISIVSFDGYDVFEIPSGTYAGIRVNRGAGGDVQITKLAPGVYQISDLLAGYYDQYVGYGPATAGPAILVINEDGVIRSELGNTEAWGGVSGQNFVFDAATNKLSYKAVFDDGFSFDVELTLK